MNPIKPSRGRPKTLDRDHVLDVAMHSYWKEDIGNLSLNEICRRSGVSKPGLYREFSNEDGLMKAVLIKYQEQVLNPVQQMLNSETPFREVLDNLVSFATSASCNHESPTGCLFIKMRESRMHLGEATRTQVDLLEEQGLVAFRKWLERSKAKGEFSADMSTAFAATYIDAQLSNASSQLARGEDPSTVKKILLVAFSMLG
ncbi:HTH-type transcriptional repressor ComR [Dickeya dianthicola]|uniref:TetR/AcrR family transcriptional regulator n=1 Tax=Dickeya dianthicola TaxID=204039 RepID=A0AAP2D400_9GAMM|nr:TetR/AcrR family transcriptional regulator [Dickeya dianthicola]AYC21238.1 HTH-type transcriptional repressor ComR [Dickeya dianthicola]MBI0436860.1 TetR/AcrR family transcriptional regulator [Dickeya dianthicola]MBI0448032.1 TetR/AcrR family transcriptional regulator [Dickeya dianthicola]MBI0452172.1 TetR/AcrR family transcriptional regulator [Dickeya dianthicola]MBI0457081.1 TetR/AcrR family transcriptional regulator [Dickeya dianthicola]